MRIKEIIALFMGFIFILICFYQTQAQMNSNFEAKKLDKCAVSFDEENYLKASECYLELVNSKNKNAHKFKYAISLLNLNNIKDAEIQLNSIIKTEKKDKLLIKKSKYLLTHLDEYSNKINKYDLDKSVKIPVYDDYFIFTPYESRWENLDKLRVYIDKNDKNYLYFKDGFKIWQEKISKKPVFYFTKDIQDAQIICKTVDTFSSKPPYPNTIGLMTTTGGFYWYSKSPENRFFKQNLVEVLDKDPKTKKDLSLDEIKFTILHEIGHSLGITWHSNIKDDIMFEDTNLTIKNNEISTRDINTLKKVYGEF